MVGWSVGCEPSVLIIFHIYIHRGAGDGPWNDAWFRFLFIDNPGATAQDLFQQVGKMIYEFGLEGFEIVIK